MSRKETAEKQKEAQENLERAKWLREAAKAKEVILTVATCDAGRALTTLSMAAAAVPPSISWSCVVSDPRLAQHGGRVPSLLCLCQCTHRAASQQERRAAPTTDVLSCVHRRSMLTP